MGPADLRELLEKHAAALELYARQWCAAPEDVVQDALLRLVQQQPAPQRVLPWLYRVVRNAAISAGRAEASRRRVEAAAGQRAAWFLPGDSEEVDAQRLTEVLASLPLEEREVIIAHLWSGLSFSEIGQVTETSSSTAHRRYQSGLERFRERLGVPCPRSS